MQSISHPRPNFEPRLGALRRQQGRIITKTKNIEADVTALAERAQGIRDAVGKLDTLIAFLPRTANAAANMRAAQAVRLTLMEEEMAQYMQSIRRLRDKYRMVDVAIRNLEQAYAYDSVGH